MNWRQQLFDASPLSRLVALQQALIRINSHSIIFCSQNICVFQKPQYTLWAHKGNYFPSSVNRNAFLRLKVPIFFLSLSLLMPCVGKHKHNHYILPNIDVFFFSYAWQFRVSHLLIWSTGFLWVVNTRVKKGIIWDFVLKQQVFPERKKGVWQMQKGCCRPHESPFSSGLLMKADWACVTSPHSHYLVKQPP